MALDPTAHQRHLGAWNIPDVQEGCSTNWTTVSESGDHILTCSPGHSNVRSGLRTIGFYRWTGSNILATDFKLFTSWAPSLKKAGKGEATWLQQPSLPCCTVGIRLTQPVPSGDGSPGERTGGHREEDGWGCAFIRLRFYWGEKEMEWRERRGGRKGGVYNSIIRRSWFQRVEDAVEKTGWWMDESGLGLGLRQPSDGAEVPPEAAIFELRLIQWQEVPAVGRAVGGSWRTEGPDRGSG